MHCNVWHDKNLCGTNLCNWRLTRIIRINKTRAEKYRFMVNETNAMYSGTSLLRTSELRTPPLYRRSSTVPNGQP